MKLYIVLIKLRRSVAFTIARVFASQEGAENFIRENKTENPTRKYQLVYRYLDD